jgi:hypothetical protein
MRVPDVLHSDVGFTGLHRLPLTNGTARKLVANRFGNVPDGDPYGR